jgi:uncharacterized protein (TIGR02001 family)
MIKSRIAAGAALLAIAGAAHAGSFSVTPAIVSDYDFRGATQSDEDPAFQLGASYNFDSGFYVGAWGSTVKFPNPSDDIELDFFAGYAGETESFGYDVGANYYTYPGWSDLNTVELYAGISKDWLSAQLWYSPDYASSDEDGFYLEANAAYPIAQVEGLSLLAHVGRSFGDASGSFVKTLDYSVGVGYSIANIDFAVKYVDTNKSAWDADRVVATISTTLPWGK